jgi:hypothetical protein
VEERTADIPGLVVPSWDSVTRHEFEPRDDECLVLDTATMTPTELVDRCDAYVTESLNL